MKKILAVILALTMVLALAACGAAPTTAEPAPEAPDPLKSEMPSKIYEESAAANPEGKTVNILLVIDMQKDFVDQALGTAEAQAIVPNVVAKINEYKERGDVIIATKDTHEESYLETQEGVNLPFIHCVQDTEGWQLDDAVQAAITDVTGSALPPDRLTMDEKIRIVEDLQQAGIFYMKGAVSEVAAQLGSSEATIYRYLSKLKD